MYTIGYDFGDTWAELKPLRFSVRLFTEQNVYAPDPDRTAVYVSDREVRLEATGLAWAGLQEKAEGYLKLRAVRTGEHRFAVSAEGGHAREICKAVLLQVDGIDVRYLRFDDGEKAEIDGRGAIAARRYPPSIRDLRVKMPLVFAENDRGEQWFALSKDTKLREKRFACHYDPFIRSSVLDLAHEEDRRRRGRTVRMPEWHIGKTADRRPVVLERCGDLERHFGLVPYALRSDKPAWLDDIRLVVYFHGEHWTGHVFNTFDAMADQLDWIADRMPGRRIMAFLPGWDGRYYFNYPRYEPSERMGGSAGLKRFIERANRRGVKVVLMLGSNNANADVMRELGLEDAQIRDAWGVPKWCDWVDWDYDLAPEKHGILANMGHPGYLHYMASKADQLIREYGVHGIFLDITFWWENDPRYSHYEGMKEFCRIVRGKHPDVLVFGENSYDALWGVFPMFAESYGPGSYDDVLYRYCRQAYYLAHPEVVSGSGGIHEQAWHSPEGGATSPDRLVPTLAVLADTIGKYGEEVERILERARIWQPTGEDVRHPAP